MKPITHCCPPEGSGLTPCCGKTPFELPHNDRITLDDALVTCAKNCPPWCVVLRSDCRPDEKCIGCGMEMGDHHGPLCYVGAKAYRAEQNGSEVQS